MANLNHLVARGLSSAQTFYSQSDDMPKQTIRMPTWGMLLIFFTTLAFGILYIGVRYTYGILVPTLAMIENPNASIIPTRTAGGSSEDPIDPDLPLLNNYRDGGNKTTNTKNNGSSTPPPAYEDGEALLVPTKPITSSLRHTVLHLRSRAGYFSRVRGLQILFVQGILAQIISGIFGAATNRLIVQSIVLILSSVLLVRFTLAWNHHVITEPPSQGLKKSWVRRLRGGQGARKIIPAVVVHAIAEQLVIAIPMFLGWCWNLHFLLKESGHVDTDGQRAVYGLKVMTVVLSGVLAELFIGLPANVVLTRVTASLLPDDDETIVPFDRSFGGKVVPAIVGGSGRIGMVEAWKSFTWEARVRLVKTYLKAALISVSVFVCWLLVIGLELKVVLGHSQKEIKI